MSLILLGQNIVLLNCVSVPSPALCLLCSKSRNFAWLSNRSSLSGRSSNENMQKIIYNPTRRCHVIGNYCKHKNMPCSFRPAGPHDVARSSEWQILKQYN